MASLVSNSLPNFLDIRSPLPPRLLPELVQISSHAIHIRTANQPLNGVTMSPTCMHIGQCILSARVQTTMSSTVALPTPGCCQVNAATCRKTVYLIAKRLLQSRLRRISIALVRPWRPSTVSVGSALLCRVLGNVKTRGVAAALLFYRKCCLVPSRLSFPSIAVLE